MDVSEQKYKKIINNYRPLMNNVISEYPISLEVDLPLIRNLKHIVYRENYSNDLPSKFYEEVIDQIKLFMDDAIPEVRLLALRLARSLPFVSRIKLLEEAQNELGMFMSKMENQVVVQNSSPDKKGTGPIMANTNMGGNLNNLKSQFHYESIADFSDFLLSVYELTSLSEEIYFDVNQKITSIFSRIFENCLKPNQDISRNSFEALRAIAILFGPNKERIQQDEAVEIIPTPFNKLISKLIIIFSKQQSYDSYDMPESTFTSEGQCLTNPIIRQLILKVRQNEVRVRCRMLTGIAFLLTHIPDYLPELYQLVIKQTFLIMHNANEFDTNFECYFCIKFILALPLEQSVRNNLLKMWADYLFQLAYSYKKEYFQFFMSILREISQSPHYPILLKYAIGIGFIELTTLITQQQNRFILYKYSCRAILSIMNSCKSNIIMNFFQYTWFINRARDQSDLFRSQFLICLLHENFSYKSKPHEVQDLISLCHALLDWQCSSKEQTHIPTIKFAFDLYLQFLKDAAEILGNDIQKYVQQLIERCNQPKMYILFKFKLIATFIRLKCYSQSLLTYSETKLDLSFLSGEVFLFMMPKNPKPIFDLEYSLTLDGQIESRKEIETIKVIMDLLAAIEEIHKDKQQQVSKIILQYHQYLANLETQPGSNRDLINCLQSLEADNYFTESQRNFLIALIDQDIPIATNLDFTLDGRMLYSPMELFDYDQEYNIFGGMSPVHLKIRIVGARSYTSVFIELKKSQWVTIPEMKLVISSAIQVKEIPFQSCIVQIKVDRIGLINFEAWTTQGTMLMLGSGSHRINRNFKWLKADHLKIIDGIRSKAFLQNFEKEEMRKDGTYLTFCFGQPILVQVIYSRNEIVVTVSNKQIWNQIQQIIAGMLEQLADGSAEIIGLNQ